VDVDVKTGRVVYGNASMDTSLELTIRVRTSTASLRSTGTLTVNLTREATSTPLAVKPPPESPFNPVGEKPPTDPNPPAKGTLTDADLTKLLEDLKSTQFPVKNKALERLRDSAPIEARRAEVVRILEQVSGPIETNHFYRVNSKAALNVWADAASVPVLLERFSPNEKNLFVKTAAIAAVARFKTEQVAEALAAQLAESFLRQHVSKALKTMAAVAEKAVVKQLSHPDWATRLEACKVLQEVGTRASVAALQKAAGDSNGLVAKAGADALQAAQTR
jgi:HEAT repeat protein